MGSPTLKTALQRLIEALRSLQIPFMIGGSLASSIHGVARATVDVDLVAGIYPMQAGPLAAALSRDFYADVQIIQSALQAGRGFNIIHVATSYKFDIFPVGNDPFYQSQFERRTPKQISLGGESVLEAEVATAEDTVLAKLAWYRLGGEVSERQWNDIRGVMAVQGAHLDLDYMRRWSSHLRVEDLLDAAVKEST